MEETVVHEPSPPEERRPFWRLPPRAIAVVLAVEVGALALVAALATTPTPAEIGLAGFLTLLAVVHTELATGIEAGPPPGRGTSYFDLSSVWRSRRRCCSRRCSRPA
ncbi:hypothetical protein BJF78_26905 [Pseudonocardia sp. CNS-139]|nr:hypothetical protein BJF78_26905 [Pseudonocardia sp. CNS-139]